jgi:Conserved hypothetical protein 2217 (DUF2460)
MAVPAPRSPPSATARVSQEVVETLDAGPSEAHVSQEVVEVIDAGSGAAHVSQEVVETLDVGAGAARVSQENIEVLDVGPLLGRASQIVIEVLCIGGVSPPTPLIYPDFTGDANVDLPGVTYDVTRRVKFSTEIDQHTSGREVRVGYWTYPLYEWDLVYGLLRDFPCGTIPSELRRLEGLFLIQQGALSNAATPGYPLIRPGGFLFRDPDDYQVSSQVIATANGTQRFFPVVRTYGDQGYGVTVTEAIGWVDLTQPFNVYINGVLQSSSSYILWQNAPFGAPGWQVLSFNSTPTAGQVITVDVTYYFYVRFTDDYLDFEEFARQFWLTRKVTLSKLRPARTQQYVDQVLNALGI